MMKGYIKTAVIGLLIYALFLGAFIWYTNKPEVVSNGYEGLRNLSIIAISVAGALLLCFVIVYKAYLYKHISSPLKKMYKYADTIAKGDITKPIDLENDNGFGRFTDSFGLMIDELKASRKREIKMKEDEYDLLTDLCHDLRNPVGGIKLTSELIKTKLLTEGITKDDEAYVTDKLDNIFRRADQIETLAASLLSSTVNEIEECRLACSDVDARVIGDILKKHDYRNVTQIATIPNVLIYIDTRRMSEVLEHIIMNSYKYANTKIDVGFLLTDEYLQMKISDHGPGVYKDELDLLTQRFYRCRKWVDSEEEGNGLGLYIAKVLMEKMEGKLLVENTDDGFAVTLLIMLSSYRSLSYSQDPT